ncbi:hypothetical protein CPU12_02255 [Malaciobacter molluscorum LMG 25693]|uniref:Membrane protein n=1 Tax=Malaciobacter molluscorum LMG 25693 TaxID=870501 RepID=A0A2G1DKT5_9BACT|nr:hypothetical protein [Malaciobacter molluscorum]AXX92669.1 putative membrane protein [Malaciobacter molluscorum LMG 25693]PHO19089.1 hypothetical protein CPU12_02255 [Malaciobacter molluscorum LMG 25693]RXJ97395.1 hypothetical protein CRV00_00740 [Malaciobacter molluscorum]
MLILEALGAIFSILGAFLMSLSTKYNQRPLYFAFISFLCANLSLLAFFLFEGKVPMLVQLCFFYAGAFLGIVRKSNNPKRDFKIVLIISIIYFIILLTALYFKSISSIHFEVLILDSSAASMAIIGNFLLSSRNHIIRSYAFILFFLADLLYVFVGYSNEFYFFMIQSMFFLFTSINGYKNTMKEEIKEFFKKKFK